MGEIKTGKSLQESYVKKIIKLLNFIGLVDSSFSP